MQYTCKLNHSTMLQQQTFESHSLSALMLMKTLPCWVGMIASYSHRATRPMPRPRFHLTYLDKVQKTFIHMQLHWCLHQLGSWKVQLSQQQSLTGLHCISPVGYRGDFSLFLSCEGVGLREAVLPHAFLYNIRHVQSATYMYMTLCMLLTDHLRTPTTSICCEKFWLM